MPRTRNITMLMALVITTTILAACGAVPSATTPQTAPPSTAALAAAPPTVSVTVFSPTDAPMATSTTSPTSAPTDAPMATSTTAPTSAPLADTNPAKPDDATQARLRVSYCFDGGSQATVFVNGKVAVNGGMPQDNLVRSQTSGYLYLMPGTYSIALVPKGMDIDKAWLGPVDVPVVAGHRYTVVALGQGDEPSHTPLVIDETAAYQQAGLSPESWGHITINNIRGAQGISFLFDGLGAKNVPYGAFTAAANPAGKVKDFKVIYSGAADQMLENNGAAITMPAIDFFDCFNGSYPNALGSFSSAPTSSLNIIDFLQAQSDASPQHGGQRPAYTTFLAAIKRAGLSEQLATGGPYLVFAPTDDAFAALPKEEFDALLADPNALADLLLNHIVEGYYPYGSLSPAPVVRGFNRTVTNMRGEQLKLSGDEHGLTINGEAVALAGANSATNFTPGDAILVANGVWVRGIAKVLLPAAQ